MADKFWEREIKGVDINTEEEDRTAERGSGSSASGEGRRRDIPG